jgi:hypothetical protein
MYATHTIRPSNPTSSGGCADGETVMGRFVISPFHRFSGSQRERETREDYDAGVERYRTALIATEMMLAQTRAAQDQDK